MLGSPGFGARVHRLAAATWKVYAGRRLRPRHRLSDGSDILQAAEHRGFAMLHGTNLGTHDEHLCAGTSATERSHLGSAAAFGLAEGFRSVRRPQGPQSRSIPV